MEYSLAHNGVADERPGEARYNPTSHVSSRSRDSQKLYGRTFVPERRHGSEHQLREEKAKRAEEQEEVAGGP